HADQLRGADDQCALGDLYLDAVDGDGAQVLGWRSRGRTGCGRGDGHWASTPFSGVVWWWVGAASAGRAAQTVEAAGSKGQPRWRMCSRYSSRKYFSEEAMGIAAPSPSAQKDLPLMLSATSASLARSSSSPLPSSIPRSSWTSQYVPSRQGVHLPQDSCA